MGRTGMPLPASRQGWIRGRFLMISLEMKVCWILIVPRGQSYGIFVK